MQRVPIKPSTIAGPVPGLHPALAPNPMVLDGKNYRWLQNHVVSGWGNDFVDDEALPSGLDYTHSKLVRVGVRSLLLTLHGVYELRARKWVKAFSFQQLHRGYTREQLDYPWTTAFVGDQYFFNHPAVGIIAYSYPTNTWKHVGEELASGDCGIDGPYYAIAAIDNRLVVQTLDTISWSMPDDGEAISCDTIGGGNFVSSSVAEYGQPLGVVSFGRTGIVWTTNGSIRLVPFSPAQSQANTLIELGFTVVRMPDYPTPINPYAWAQAMNSSAFALTKQGLLMLNEQSTEFVSPEYSNWFIEYLIPRFALTHNQHSISLEFSNETAELFVSHIHLNPRFQKSNIYSRAHVFSVRHEKWCSFDQEHISIGPVNFEADRHLDYMLGFLSSDDRVHWFNYAYHNSYGELHIPLDSYVSVGPFTLEQNEELFSVESSLLRMELLVENNPEFFSVGEVYYNKNKNPVAPFEASVSTYSDNDGFSAMDQVPSTPVVSLAKKNNPDSRNLRVQTYGCNGRGRYHTIHVNTSQDTVDQFYSIATMRVELGTTNSLT